MDFRRTGFCLEHTLKLTLKLLIEETITFVFQNLHLTKMKTAIDRQELSGYLLPHDQVKR